MSLSAPAESSDSVVVLDDVTWQMYSTLREAEQNRHVRMTFDQGRLFLMSPSRLHERIAELLGRMICAWTEVNDIPLLSAGSTTMKSRLLKRGLEPDKCFYIQNEALVRNSDGYDATIDPAPDLAIEVDVTSLSVVRMPIYAEFGVPEIWRWVEERIEMYRLENKTYMQTSESGCLPGFPLNNMLEHLAKRRELDETALLCGFRASIS